MKTFPAVARPKIGVRLRHWDLPPGRIAPRWNQILDMASAADEAGLDSVWMCDDLLIPWMADGPLVGVWEGWSLLTAVAAVTRRVEVGHIVVCSGFRNPALLAKMADTVDEISGGRFILGLGAGGVEYEHVAFGFPWERRVSRFEEALQVIRPLLRDGRVDFQGEFYSARECELRPRGPRPTGPPILIAALQANAPRILRLTAEYADMWHGRLGHVGQSAAPDEVPPLREAVDAACHKAGRDPSSLARTVRVGVSFPGDDDFPWEDETPIRGSAEEIAQAFWALADEGIDHLMIVPAPETPASIEQIGRVIEDMDRGR